MRDSGIGWSDFYRSGFGNGPPPFGERQIPESHRQRLFPSVCRPSGRERKREKRVKWTTAAPLFGGLQPPDALLLVWISLFIFFISLKRPDELTEDAHSMLLRDSRYLKKLRRKGFNRVWTFFMNFFHPYWS